MTQISDRDPTLVGASVNSRTLIMLLGGLFFVTVAALQSQTDPSPRPGAVVLDIERQIREMSPSELAGQLIAPGVGGTYLREDDPRVLELEAAAREGRIGGVVLFAGDPRSTRWLVDRLQAASEIPLLMSSDYEWGVAMRVAGATRFPRALALAAAGDREDARQGVRALAEITAREARELGVGLILAPVADVWSEPLNRVIANRSFGSDPELVGDLVGTYVSTLESAGVLAAVKHFPGHGATRVDSHVGLPILEIDGETLRSRELVPFRRAIRANASSIMVGHLAVPEIDGRVDRPVSRSKEAIDGLLRGQMGFDGLVVSDALDMAGLGADVTEGRAAVEAVLAGVDMLLKPARTDAVHRALVEAIVTGELPRARLEDAVRRVLRAKQKLQDSGALTRSEAPRDPSWAESSGLDVGASGAQADRSAALAVTVLRNRVQPVGEPLLPLGRSAVGAVETHLVGEGADRLRLFERLLSRRAATVAVDVSSDSGDEEGRVGVMAAVDGTVYTSSRRREDRPAIVAVVAWRRAEPEAVGQRVLELQQRGLPVVAVSFGSPHSLSGSQQADAVVSAYDSADVMQRAVAAALFGERAVNGRLPLAVEGWSLGSGVDVEALPVLQSARPETVGMSKDGLDEAVRVLRDGIEDGATPGAVVLIARRGRLVVHDALGTHDWSDDSKPVELDTLYDLASLTKVVATTTLAMRAVDSGLLDLASPVSRYLPEFSDERTLPSAPSPDGEPASESFSKAEVLVGDLMTHSSGVLWWTDLYSRNRGLDPRAAKRQALAEIFALPLESRAGEVTRYSDLGILLLGEILERLHGRSLEELADDQIFGPLGMTSTMYRPGETELQRIPPTENDPWRGAVVRGEVHDENAASLGGIAPHAGLFSTASNLGVFSQMLLNRGAYGGHRLLASDTVTDFTRRAERVSGSSRALGWDTPSSPSSAGRYFSESSFGHTGFTGTSIWIDPERDLFAILLTNRVHPTRENRKLVKLRGRFHDAVMKAIVDEPVQPVRE